MVGIAFAFVETEVDTGKSSGLKVCSIKFDRSTLAEVGVQTIPCYLALFGLAEVFELIMALDALKLRNIIQLLGILGESSVLKELGAISRNHSLCSLSRRAHCHGGLAGT